MNPTPRCPCVSRLPSAPTATANRACSTPRGRTASLAIAAGTVLSVCGAASAQTSALWAGPVDGDWTDATKWSTNPNYPDNNTYDATINALGSAYTVSLGTNITINSLLLNSSFATLHHTAGRLSIANSLEIRSGTYSLNGGTIGGGLLRLTGGTLAVSTNSNNRLSGVTLQGGLTLGTLGARLRISDGFAHNNIMFINGENSAVSFDGTQTITTGFFSFSGTASPGRKLTIEGPSTVTLNSGVTVSGGSNAVVGGQLAATGGNTLVNKGTIRAGLNNSSLFVSPASLTNQGTMLSQSNGILNINAANWTSSGAVTADGASSKTNLSGNWSSTGTLNAINGGTLNLGGSFPSTGLGTLNVGGGTVNVTGTMNNTGNTFTFNNATGSWNMNGGTIQGGTLQFANGKTLNFAGNDQNRLNGVTYNADLDLSNSNSFLTIGNGLTLNGVARLGETSILTFAGTQTFNTGSINFQGNTARVESINGTLTLGPAMTIDAHNFSASRVGARGGNLTNQGRITTDGAGGYLNVLSDNLTNSGVIEGLNGSTLRICESGNTPGNWSNTGILRVNNSTLSLGGSFTTSGMGTIERTGGSVILEGRLDNTGSTLTFNSTTGSWHVDGASTIVAGTINHTQGAGLLFDIPGSGSSAVFDGITLNGDITVPTPDRGMILRNGITLNGTIRLTGDRTRMFLDQNQNHTITGGTIAIEAPTNQNAYAMLKQDSTLTISPTTLVRGGNGGIASQGTQAHPTTLINQGHILADIPGQNLSAGAWNFSNEGTLEATNGGSLTVGAANPWSNTGLIKINGGTFMIGGIARLDPGTTFQRNGGTFRLGGILDNTGRTFTLDSSTGSLSLVAGSTLRGGTVNLTQGSQLVPESTGFAAKLQGITLNGDLSLGAFQSVNILDGITLNGSVLMSDASNVFLGPGLITGGTFQIQMNSSGSGGDVMRVGGFDAVTLSPTTVVKGNKATLFRNTSSGAQNSVTNQGLISAESAGDFIFLKPDLFLNEGTLQAKDGGLLQIDYWTRWSNTGTIRVETGGSVFLGGRTTSAGLGNLVNDGGTIYLSALVENTGSTLTLNATTGSLVFSSDSGVIKGGTVNLTQGTRLESNGVGHLDGVTVNGDLAYREGSIVVRNGLTLNGTAHLNTPGAQLRFEGTQTFNTGTIAFEGSDGAPRFLSGGDEGGSTLTLGTAAVVHGGNGWIFTSNQISIANYGLISADVSGQKITINTDRFDNQGTLQAINGGLIELIDPPGPFGADPKMFVNSGLLSIGVGSTALVRSVFIQTPTGILELHLGAAGTSGTISAFGDTQLDGTLRITLDAGATAVVGERFHLLSMARARSEFAVLDLPGLPAGMWWDTSTLYLDGSVGVVPGPGTLAVLGLAGGVMCRAGSRSRASGIGGGR